MSSPGTAPAALGHDGAVEQPAPRAARVLATRSRLRAAFSLARAEGWLLAGNTFVAGGLVVAAVVAWSFLSRGSRCGGKPPGRSATPR
jgi:hypothetical protein